MEIRCDNCSHVGPAAEVRPQADGVVLVCENCGHENMLETGASNEASAPVEQPPKPDQTSKPEQAPKPRQAAASTNSATYSDRRADGFGDSEQVRMWLRDDALKALIPEQGVGPRCRKCAHLLEPDADNCSRCGLNRREAERYAPGEAPWEQPPADKAAEHEQAELLWQAFEEDRSAQAREKFVDFVRAEGLLDLGIRKLRFYLVEHPDDDRAIEHLRDLAESLQSRIIVAQVQAKASANEFKEDVSRFKNRVVTTALIFWVGVFLLFLTLFWDNCGNGMPSF